MPLLRLGKCGFRFNASHSFPHDDGYDRLLHGHDYEFSVLLESRLEPGQAKLLYDMRNLKPLVQDQVIAVLDHTNLNDLLPDPSSEAVAQWIWQRLRNGIPQHLRLGVQLWETRSIYVEYWGDA